MTMTVRSFTRCADCAHALEVLEPDQRGVKRVSAEVAHCTIYQQFRAVRITRTCEEFQRRKDAA